MTRTIALVALLAFPLFSPIGIHTGLSGHRIWVASVQPNVDSAPAYLPHVRLPDGRRRAVVFVLAGNNGSDCDPGNPVRRATTYAFDAGSGKVLWSRSTTGPSRCTTAGPEVEPSGTWVYAPGLDGKVHRYAAGSGKEAIGHGWPMRISLMPDVEKMSAAPTIGSGHLYVTTSGFIGDQGHYEGHLVTIDLATGHARVFNTLCSSIRRLLTPSSGSAAYCPAVQSGLFGRGEGTVDPVTHDVYIVSGNGPWNGRTNWGDSVLKLDPSGEKLLDAFTPTNQNALNVSDQDLGSTGPALLPAVKAGGRVYHLLVQAGKGPACGSCSGVALRLLNGDNLSGRGGPGHLGGDLYDAQTPGSEQVLATTAVWRASSGEIWVFVANGYGLGGYRLSVSGRTFRLEQRWLITPGGTTPVVSHGVLYVARSGSITAYNPASHAVLWRAGGVGGIHWQYPLVVGHRLFLTDESGHLYAYALQG